MKLRQLFGDQAKQEEGVWVKHESGVEFKLAYSERTEARNFFLKRLTRARRKGLVDAAVQQAITLELLIEKVVLEWRNIEDNEGKPYPYSKENCAFVLTNSAVLRDFVSVEASDAENFGIATADDEGETAKGANKSGVAGSPAVDAGVRQ